MPSKISREQLSRENSRIEVLPGGDRILNVSAISVIFGVNYWTFMSRQQDGWLALGGEKLVPRKMGGGRENGYLESEVSRALQKPASAPDTYLVNGTMRMNRKAAKNLLGCHYNTVQVYERRGLLAGEWSQNPGTGDAEKTYEQKAVEQLREWLQKGKFRELHRDDKVYKTHKWTRKRLGVTNETLRGWRDEKKGCCHLSGEPLDAIWEYGSWWYEEKQGKKIRKSMRNWRVGIYRLSDGIYLSLGAIARDKELDVCRDTMASLAKAEVVGTKEVCGHPGRGKAKKVYKKEDIEKYLASREKKFDGVFREPDGLRFTLKAGAQKFGLTLFFVKKHVNRLSPYVEGEFLTTQKRTAPYARGFNKEVETLSEKQFATLLAGVKKAYQQDEYRKAGWPSARDLYQRLKLKDLARQIRLCCWLRERRVSGKVKGDRFWSRVKQGDRFRYRRVWRYEPESLVAALVDWEAVHPPGVGPGQVVVPGAAKRTSEEEPSKNGEGTEPSSSGLWRTQPYPTSNEEYGPKAREQRREDADYQAKRSAEELRPILKELLNELLVSDTAAKSDAREDPEGVIAQAIGFAALNQGLSVRDIAAKVGCSHTHLYKSKEFMKVFYTFREDKRDIPKGSIDADGNLEAWQEK